MQGSRNRSLVVCYYRVSSREQTVESQREECRRWAAFLEPDAELLEVEEVASASGRLRAGGHRRRDRRGVFEDLMRRCESGTVARLVCAEVSRFARDVEEGTVALNKLERLGVPVYFVRGAHDTGTIRGMQGALYDLVHSQTEAAWLSERTRAGMRRPGAKPPGRPTAVGDFDARCIVDWRDDDGWTWRAIAAELGKSLGAVCRAYKRRKSDAGS
jgi:DNA invertase Pin-like site-specific DNA recombinase